MSPITYHLTYFSLAVHKILCDEKSILHRDISTNNIMLYHQTVAPDSETKPKLRHGLLIDFDYSALIGGDQVPSDTHRTVCHFTLYIWLCLTPF
jgi:serine/threonine protein kinase